MRTILMTAYAVNPYKGSEEGTGWNLIYQSALHNKVIAVTRKNNKQDIVRYIQSNLAMQDVFDNINFLHFDLPKWMIWWKKGPLLSALYFYIWQLCVAFWLKKKHLEFDIAHSVNFHSNWTPSFLWILGKPFVWGPVGNHPLIPKQYIKKIYGTKAYLQDRLLWIVKWLFWNLDPFVYICRKKAVKVFCVNNQAAKKLRLPGQKVIFMPAVASEETSIKETVYKNDFTVLSVGRFVPLKGFDLAIRAFAKFYKAIPFVLQSKARLIIIGTGPEQKKLEAIIEEEKIDNAITIYNWMPREKVIEQFKDASVYLFPSHEGAGMVVAEAMSYGLPVICLDNYGPGEYVHPNSALKVEQSNYLLSVQDLSRKLKLIFYNEEEYKKESNLSLIQYNKHFTWSRKGELMNDVYNVISPEEN